MISWMQDLRYAIRQLRKSPGFTVSAVLTLAVAIAANAVVFSVLNGLILRPLNVPRAKNLYSIQRTADKELGQSYPDFVDLRDRNRTFEAVTGYGIIQAAVDTGAKPSEVWGVQAASNYFDALHIQPYVGRFFHGSDEHGPNSAPYMVLSYAYWHTQFHDDREVVGRVIQLNKNPFTIIGVAPPSFRGTLVFFSPQFFVPLVQQEQTEGWSGLNDRSSRSVLAVMGHLKAGVTPQQASADLNSIGTYLEKAYPKSDVKMTYSLGRPNLMGDQFNRPFQAFLAGLLLLAALILLAACANLGSLFSARATDRSREIAMRLALGSRRSRILRGLFTEALLISLMSGGIGLWASVAILRWLSDWQPFGNFPMHAPVTPDIRVYVIALFLSLLGGLLFGAVPVSQVLRTNPYEVVRAGSLVKVGRKITGRDVLLAGQIAICAVLVTASMVAVRGLARALHGNFGFEPHNSILVGADLHMAGYSGSSLAPMQRRLLTAIAAMPGVQAVGLTNELLLNDSSTSSVFTDQSAVLEPSSAAANAYTYHVSDDYLRAEGTTLLLGRNLSPRDDLNSPKVAVVNPEFAHRLFGSDRAAIGSYFKLADGTRLEVVGVTEQGKYGSLTEDPEAAMFLPILQWPSNSEWVVVRTGGEPQQSGPALRNVLNQLDPALPFNLEMRGDEMATALFPSQIATVALGIMGGIGAMLAITGIFGMAAYSVGKRMRELSIRVALGAGRRELVYTALGKAFKLLAFGSTVGLLLGVLASRVLGLIVYEATPRDPLVLAAAVLSMALLGLLASWIPARRALSADPAILLREE